MTFDKKHTTAARRALIALTPALLLVACGDDGAPETDTMALPDTGSESADTSASSTGSADTTTSSDESSTGSADSSTGGSDTGSTGANGSDSDSGSDSGTDGSGSTGDMNLLEIAGAYVDNFQQMHEVGDELWVMSGDGYELRFEIETFDNDGDMLVARNGEDNGSAEGQYSRFTWFTDAEGQLWYCQDPYDAASVEAAMQADPPDSSMPGDGGCGIGSWSALDPVQ